MVLDPVCAERLTVTEPQVWTNTYQGWGGFALVAWQPLPAGSGGMMAFGVGDEYCVPVTPTPEPAPTPDPLDWYVICTLRPNEPLGDIEVNVRDQPNLTTSVIVGTLGAGERVHRISLDPTDEVPFGPNVVFALVSYNWDEFVNGVPFVRHTEAWVARKDYYGALLVQPRPPECPPITPTPTPTLPPSPTPTPDPRVPLASPGRFDDAPNAPNGFQSLFEDGEAPANVGSLGIHGKGTIDVMPASLEECIDTNTYSASIGCDPEGTTQGIPIYAPVDGNAYAVDGGVNVAIWWETEARRTDVTDGEAVVVRREIFLSHLDPATTTPFLTVRSVRRGDLIGFLCLHLDRERCNIPIPQRDQRDRETNFTVNHLAVQVRFYNSSNVVYPPLDSEVLGVLAIPNCIFDSWAEDHLSPPTPKTPGAPGTLAACPS